MKLYKCRRTTTTYSEAGNLLDKNMATYTKEGDTGGARGGKGLRDKRGTGK
jgi:hypothetical protein